MHLIFFVDLIAYNLYEQPLEDLEEPSDAQYINAEYLNEDDQYDLNTCHGWDLHKKGGGIQLYPNIPHICLPLPKFQGKVQVCRSSMSLFQTNTLRTANIDEFLAVSSLFLLLIKTCFHCCT